MVSVSIGHDGLFIVGFPGRFLALREKEFNSLLQAYYAAWPMNSDPEIEKIIRALKDAAPQEGEKPPEAQ